MGGGHGDHHHHHPKIGETEQTKVPDYRIYKVEDCPQLMVTQRMLAQKGLKDPWLRNYVWIYPKTDPSRGMRLLQFCTQGFKYGFAAFVLSVALDTGYNAIFPSSHNDHEHKHH